MKRNFVLYAVIFSLVFFISCGDKKSDKENNDDTDDNENTVTDKDSENTDEIDIDDNDDTAECTGLSFNGMTIVEGYPMYQGVPLDGIGDKTLEDSIAIQFYNEDLSAKTELAKGTFDLSAELNTNYSSCTECVLLYEDFGDNSYSKTYFQKSGTMTITDVKAGTLESKGTLSAKLIEVTIDSESFETTPVEGGGCYEIETGIWDNICVPSCEGKVCGDDGCGGKCGKGCGLKNCNTDGTACVEYECTGISFDSMDVVPGAPRYQGVPSEEIGDKTLEDAISIHFYNKDLTGKKELAKGTFDLSAGLNANFSSCTECVLIYEDIVEGASSKVYFQQSGTMKINDVKAGTIESKGTLSAKLIEVNIDSETYGSTPVQNGGCYEIETGVWDNICIPDCEGKICGDDGCGGTCGKGCDDIDKTCNEEGTECINFNCKAITFKTFATGTISADEDYFQYDVTYSPNTGDTKINDEMMLEFYTAPKTATEYNLENTNYSDCNECIIVFEDVTEESVTKIYFQQKGKITLSSFNTTDGKMKGTLENVRLVEVTVDTSTFESKPVQSGECLEFVKETIEIK